MTHTKIFLDETIKIINSIDKIIIDRLAIEILKIRDKKGRLFICGAGGSAGHASHAVNDFRKLVGVESYSPTDNVSEVTARTNDEGWQTVYEEYLKVSNLNNKDGILIFSVGGGSVEPPVSEGLVRAINYAKSVDAKVLGIVGRDGGFTAQKGDVVLVIPHFDASLVTPQTEGVTALIWHLLVSNPLIQIKSTKW